MPTTNSDVPAVRAPSTGVQPDSAILPDEEFVMGYGALSTFLTSKGFPIAKKTLQKVSMPSAGGGGPPIAGWWGQLPAFRPDDALAWARGRVTASRPTQARPSRRSPGRPRKSAPLAIPSTAAPPTAPAEVLPSSTEGA